MTRYNTFLSFFILSVISLVFFLVCYLQGVFAFAIHVHEFTDPNPVEIIRTLFSPAVIISGIIMGITSLIYRILGIVYVVNNKTAADGEKALWIIGFIIMGFVTGIVFLILAKTRKFVE